MNLTPIDQLWLLTCSGLVLLMQAGFLCLEAGLTRGKNAVSVAIKNLVDLTMTPLAYITVGSGIMFGATWLGLSGLPGSFDARSGSGGYSFLLFETLFCASTATIVSGAVAERMRLGAYAAVSLLIGGLIYPLIGHWAWGGVWTGAPGWLRAIGFNDFAGAGVVHMTGGFAALACVMALGPRIGRFDPERLATGFPKSSLPMAMLGALLLSVGWFGFTGGSVLRFNESIGLIVLNTVLAGSGGGVAALLIARSLERVFSPEIVINGLLAGLVAVCALANVATPFAAIIVGACAGMAAFGASSLLVRWRVDDVVGAFPVHGVGGLVGVVLQPMMPGAEFGLGDLLVQALGALTIAAAAFLPTYLLLTKLAPLDWSRVTAEEERIGLNLVEHGVESELQTLLRSLLSPTRTEAARRPIDSSDDAGALAATINQRVSQALHDGEEASRADLQQRQADDLREYGEFLHAVLNGIEKQICILDRQGRIVETNRAWNKCFESLVTSHAATSGADFLEFCRASGAYRGKGPAEITEAIELIAAGRVGRFRAEYPLRVMGNEHLVELTIYPLPAQNRGAVIITQEDRTAEHRGQQQILLEKRKAERLADALEASQTSLDLAMKGASLGLWHWDVETGYFELSTDWLESLGLDAEMFDPDVKSLRQLLHPDELVFWTPEDAASLASGEPYDRQFRLRLADGSYRWVQVLGRAVSMTAKETPECITGILIDIDARKSVELRDAGMAKIFEESENLVYVIDRQTRKFLEVNRGARENLGYTLEELQRMTPYDITPPESHVDVDKRIANLLDGTTQKIDFEAVHIRRDGTTYPAVMSVQPARLLDRDVFVAIGSDVSQRRDLERQLSEARRLESIGQLAAGVAHEMNTPLQFVGNNIEFLRECSETLFSVFEVFEQLLDPRAAPQPWVKRQQEVRSVIERTRFDHLRKETPRAIADSLEGIERVMQIVRAMKEFSHPGDQQQAPTDLNRAITSTTTVTRNRWKAAGDLTLDLDPYLPHVECQGGAINQVFVNLIVNAADAIVDRRERDPAAPEGRIVIRSYTENGDAVFEVEDNGCGMPPEVQRRVFDPFFTTKEVGKGTGQGLSLSHSIVAKTHGGEIDVKSTSPEGTVIRVRLPVRRQPDGLNESKGLIEHILV